MVERRGSGRVLTRHGMEQRAALTCTAFAIVLLSAALVGGGQGSLSRKKRWLVFPKGSSLQLVYCWLLSTFGTRDGIFVINITVGLAWEIPTDLKALLEKESRPAVESRHRRQIYSKISTLLDRQGMDGKMCVLRGICEARRVSGSKQKFLNSLLHGLFTLPDLMEDHEEYEEHMSYKSAEENWESCEQRYPCPLPLLHFL